MLLLMYRVLCFSFVLLVILALSGSGLAFADSTTGTISVTAGALMGTSSRPAEHDLTLDGKAQVVTYTLAMMLTDATGSGSGWNLTITSTQFSTGGPRPRTLPTSISFLTSVIVLCLAQAMCTNPINSIIYPLTIPAAYRAPTAVKFYNATANTGMGKFTITPMITISLPAGTYSGIYSSTITLAISSGP